MLQRLPFTFSHILQQTGAQRGPPFTILKTLRILSLKYSADLGRSRIVNANFGRSIEDLS